MFGKKSLAKFERKIPQTLKSFDDSDLTESVPVESKPPTARHHGRRVPKLDIAKKAVPDHLLVVSLLEQLCTLYESNPQRSYKLFRIICQQLTSMKVLPNVYHLEEFSSVRAQYKIALTNLMTAAVATLPKEPRHLALPSTQHERTALLLQSSSLVPRHMPMRKEEFFKAFTSRYHEEFIELGVLGKGGFGSVYKVRNKLDGREYAVKKIRLKDNDPEVCLKILREVKLLASMRHEHIVGYNSAWLETVAPKTTASNMITYQSPQTIDMQHDSYSSSNDIIFMNDSQSSMQGARFKGFTRHSRSHHREHHSVRTPQNSPNTSHMYAKQKGTGDEEDSVETLMNSPKESYMSRVTSTDVHAGKTELDIHTTSITLDYKSKVVETDHSRKEYVENVVHLKDVHERVAYAKDNNGNSEVNCEYRNPDRWTELEVLSSASGTDDEYDDEYDDSSDDLEVIELSISDSPNDGFSNSGNFTGSYSGQVVHRSVSVEPNVAHAHQRYKYENYYSDGGGTSPAKGGIFSLQYGIMLFIQMQLCSHTLRDWIMERNTAASQSVVTDPFSFVDESRNMKIFREILEGVHYIHDQGLIHRDLKPRNIFLDLEGKDCCVRIGDFGLAREDVIDMDTPLTPLHKGSQASSQDTNHTCGVGTHTYASPEQQQGSFYDNKSDIFSLGMILFELFYPFGTEMERAKWMSTVRDGVVPDVIKERWPSPYHMIKKLLSQKSTDRPSAIQVLNSELFTNKDDVIAKLESKVSEQEKELARLRLLLDEKEKYIQLMQK